MRSASRASQFVARHGAGRGWPRWRHLVCPTGAVASLLLLSACGSPSPLASSAILTANPGAQTVELDLVAGEDGAYGGFNFDGYGDGELRVSVPAGWTVDVTCTNASTTLTNSCAIIQDAALSPNGAPLAFPGASTEDPSAGLGLRDTAQFSFVASHPGEYRIASLVDGYEVDGMWDWLVVTKGGRPSVRS